MNSQIEKFARDTLKTDLARCTDGQQLVFKRMYAGGDMATGIGDVVDNMPTDKLDWAMDQVQRTLEKHDD